MTISAAHIPDSAWKIPMSLRILTMLSCLLWLSHPASGQQTAESTSKVVFGPYGYEVKPDDEAFRLFNPRKAPQPGPLLLQTGDRLAICGDSITEQKMYSRIIETYLTACVPQLQITARQYGWSGEKTDGFLRRMDQDCLTFEPTVATLAYGMNDSRYRPFDVTNGQWYEDHYTAIVRNFKSRNVRVVVGSPGSAGKIAEWVQPRAGTLDDHNLHLCALRDIAIGVAQKEDVRFADIFWPMYQAQVFAPAQHGATAEKPYNVAGGDGIHPGWAGQVIMAWSFLRALGIDGEIGTLEVSLKSKEAKASDGHRVDSFENGRLTITSTRYPFCARGDEDSDNSILSGMTLVPFAEDLNRFILKLNDAEQGSYKITWGSESKEFTGEQLSAGIFLAKEFPENPFCAAFDKVDAAVFAKQQYETTQVKQIFNGAEGKADFSKAVAETEAVRKPLADAIAAAVVPVTHSIQIEKLK
jgi:lysophospholipase L1-like esterase